MNNGINYNKLIRDFIAKCSSRQRVFLLDAGCGQGQLTAGLNVDRVGLDIYRPIIRKANQIYNDNKSAFIVADLHKLPFCRQIFNIIVVCDVIEHLWDPVSVLREMKRVSNNKANLIIATPNKLNPIITLEQLLPSSFIRAIFKLMKRKFEEPRLYRLNTPNQLTRELTNEGYDVKQLIMLSECFFDIPLVYYVSKIWQKIYAQNSSLKEEIFIIAEKHMDSHKSFT